MTVWSNHVQRNAASGFYHVFRFCSLLLGEGLLVGMVYLFLLTQGISGRFDLNLRSFVCSLDYNTQSRKDFSKLNQVKKPRFFKNHGQASVGDPCTTGWLDYVCTLLNVSNDALRAA